MCKSVKFINLKMPGQLDPKKCGNGQCDGLGGAGHNYIISNGEVEKKRVIGGDITQSDILAQKRELTLKSSYDTFQKPNSATYPGKNLVDLTRMLNARNESFIGFGESGVQLGVVRSVSSKKGDVIVVATLLLLLFWLLR